MQSESEQEGTGFPLFCIRKQVFVLVMELKNLITEQLQHKFEEKDFSDYFLVDIKLGPKKIQVFIDGVEGISLGVCAKISRYLEQKLDAEDTLRDDYILEVSSPGIKMPLKFEKQYPKHKGRQLEIQTTEGQRIKATLVEVENEQLLLERQVTEKKGKKKIKKTKSFVMPFKNIEKAFVKASI